MSRIQGDERFEIRRVATSHPDALMLIDEVQEEYRRRYGSRDDSPVADIEFTAPEGAFFVGYLCAATGERPVATAAWRTQPDLAGELGMGGTRVAEIKRMFVRPDVQRRGLARRMLAHVEGDAVAAGHDLVVLGTGDRQPEAIALYESSGYRPVSGFGHYRDTPGSRHYARRLS